MVGFFMPQSPPGGGIGAPFLKTTAFMRGTAAVVGDVLQFDTELSDAAVTNYLNGDSASAWRNVVPPTAAGVLGLVPTLFCVALEAIADDAEGEVCYFGRCEAFVIAGSGTFDSGASMVVTTARNFDLVDAAGEPHVATLDGTPSDTTPTTRTLADVFLFNTFLAGSGIA